MKRKIFAVIFCLCAVCVVLGLNTDRLNYNGFKHAVELIQSQQNFQYDIAEVEYFTNVFKYVDYGKTQTIEVFSEYMEDEDYYILFTVDLIDEDHPSFGDQNLVQADHITSDTAAEIRNLVQRYDFTHTHVSNITDIGQYAKLTTNLIKAGLNIGWDSISIFFGYLHNVIKAFLYLIGF